MIRFFKGLYWNVQLASDLRKIASRYAGEPDRMREGVVKAIRRNLAARQTPPSARTAERLERVAA